MMTYPRTFNSISSGRGGKRPRLIFIAGAIVFLVFACVQYFIPHFLPAIFTTIARPFWRAEFSIESGSLRSPGSLLTENEDLRRQLLEADVRLQTIQSIEQENVALKSFFGRDAGSGSISSTTSALPDVASSSILNHPKSVSPAASNSRKSTISSSKYILAAVLMRPPMSPYDELIIDAGKDLNIAAGDDVYAIGNILIGKVSDVLGNTSKVILFSSPSQTHEVLIGASNAPASAIGRGGGQYSAELPASIKVSEGDAVISPSIGDRPLGIVSGIINDPARAFETVLFAPPVDLYELRWILIERR